MASTSRTEGEVVMYIARRVGQRAIKGCPVRRPIGPFTQKSSFTDASPWQLFGRWS